MFISKGGAPVCVDVCVDVKDLLLQANKCTFGGRQMHCVELTRMQMHAYMCVSTVYSIYTHIYRCATRCVTMETGKQRDTHAQTHRLKMTSELVRKAKAVCPNEEEEEEENHR